MGIYFLRNNFYLRSYYSIFIFLLYIYINYNMKERIICEKMD